MKRFRTGLALIPLFILFILWLAPAASTTILAQDDSCPALVQTALAATRQLCDGTGRDQACYGHVLLEAQAQPGLGALKFEEPGDKVDVTALRSLQLSAMDLETGLWGVARMQLRANLPASKPENVTLLMFGDVAIENAVEPSATADVTVSVPDYINVRLSPSDKAGVLGTLAPEQTVRALARLADNSWLRVELPGSGLTGWVYAPLVTPAQDLQTLKVVDARAPHYGPMQAFYFRSGADENAGCSEMPTSGFLIQTPEGAGEVNLMINEVNIKIGSTVYFTAQPGRQMAITTIEGKARVNANGVEATAYAGTTVRVPLDENLAPAGAPTPPEPYNEAALRNLPLDLLPDVVPVLPPLTQAEINARNAQASANGAANDAVNDAGNDAGNGAGCACNPAEGAGDSMGGNPGCAGDDCNAADVAGENCPGQSCNAPGQGGSCPGNSCTNAGQGGGDCPGNSCAPPGQGQDAGEKDKGKGNN